MSAINPELLVKRRAEVLIHLTTFRETCLWSALSREKQGDNEGARLQRLYAIELDELIDYITERRNPTVERQKRKAGAK